MEVIKRSMRTKRKGATPESSKPYMWQDDEKKVREGTCSFQVKYHGCIEVLESRGIQVCEDAINLLKNSRGRQQQKAVLYVSGDSLKVVDELSKGLIVDQTIEKVSFCAPDRTNERGFAYICREGTTRRWMCHAFMALKESGERLSHAVGCAFTICLERKQQREKEKVLCVSATQGSTLCSSGALAQPGPGAEGLRVARTGYFRPATLRERLADPQSTIRADPVPVKHTANPFAVERPRATSATIGRQGSLPPPPGPAGNEKAAPSPPNQRACFSRICHGFTFSTGSDSPPLASVGGVTAIGGFSYPVVSAPPTANVASPPPAVRRQPMSDAVWLEKTSSMAVQVSAGISGSSGNQKLAGNNTVTVHVPSSARFPASTGISASTRIPVMTGNPVPRSAPRLSSSAGIPAPLIASRMHESFQPQLFFRAGSIDSGDEAPPSEGSRESPWALPWPPTVSGSLAERSMSESPVLRSNPWFIEDSAVSGITSIFESKGCESAEGDRCGLVVSSKALSGQNLVSQVQSDQTKSGVASFDQVRCSRASVGEASSDQAQFGLASEGQAISGHVTYLKKFVEENEVAPMRQSYVVASEREEKRAEAAKKGRGEQMLSDAELWLDAMTVSVLSTKQPSQIETRCDSSTKCSFAENGSAFGNVDDSWTRERHSDPAFVPHGANNPSLSPPVNCDHSAHFGMFYHSDNLTGDEVYSIPSSLPVCALKGRAKESISSRVQCSASLHSESSRPNAAVSSSVEFVRNVPGSSFFSVPGASGSGLLVKEQTTLFTSANNTSTGVGVPSFSSAACYLSTNNTRDSFISCDKTLASVASNNGSSACSPQIVSSNNSMLAPVYNVPSDTFTLYSHPAPFQSESNIESPFGSGNPANSSFGSGFTTNFPAQYTASFLNSVCANFPASNFARDPCSVPLDAMPSLPYSIARSKVSECIAVSTGVRSTGCPRYGVDEPVAFGDPGWYPAALNPSEWSGGTPSHGAGKVQQRGAAEYLNSTVAQNYAEGWNARINNQGVNACLDSAGCEATNSQRDGAALCINLGHGACAVQHYAAERPISTDTVRYTESWHAKFGVDNEGQNSCENPDTYAALRVESEEEACHAVSHGARAVEQQDPMYENLPTARR